MTELNELSKFEKDLKDLIESRNNFKPHYNCNNTYSQTKGWSEQASTYMAVPEHGNPYKCDEMTLMGVPEHGRPIFATRMAIGEHGQPYRTSSKNNKIVTKMFTEEHGKPFNFNPFSTRGYSRDRCPNITGKKCGRMGCKNCSIFSFFIS